MNGNPVTLFGAAATADGSICPRESRAGAGEEPSRLRWQRALAGFGHTALRRRFLCQKGAPRDGEHTVSRDTGPWPRRAVEIPADCKPGCEFPYPFV